MIGITEQGDAALDLAWIQWVNSNKPAILITKDPLKLFKTLIKEYSILPNIIVHATITGLGGTDHEPNVPQYEMSLTGYRGLIQYLGKDRVVLRVDPVYPSEKGLKRASLVIAQHEETRIRISFLDAYNHVKEKFRNKKMTPPPYKFHAPLETRQIMYRKLYKIANRHIEVCGEPGFSCTGCISELDCKTLGVNPPTKTSGQRPTCTCLAIKKELLSNKKPCFHNCIYCYWK